MPTLGETVVVAALAGCATGLGALPTLVTDRVSHRVYDGAIGLAAGIMVGAAVFALVVPGLELGSAWEVVAGVLVGGAFLLATNALLPHVHLRFRADRLEGTAALEASGTTPPDDDLRRALLVGAAVTIHNVPEGLAVGIAFGSGEAGLGFLIATAIAVQNVPDGFAMAVPADRAGVSWPKTLLYTTLSGGLPEPIAAAVGFSLVALVTGLFPAAAGFAAGAMIAVVFRELVPSSHGHGYADTATATFVAGFALMLVVDTVLAV
ncbi:ZIP family metal transporter [Natrialbaceae archaeon AArc-T1-2]|uniref:ZIP family metal transporter n=1 Tax=Natrialbaceae archaeon AArc-T1-2 TaxID=3053904 RepID=UPI00255A8523|nr:ZIP family metal transporter [Natrialbaceae archaeon AArc-T1-2]WIV67577.1 ZIP family metal transporter [Natrialbaceae archaeon AArc-T1-2]